MVRTVVVTSYMLFVFISLQSRASSCCGQSPASYTVLSMSQRLSVSTGVSYLRSQGRVFSDSKAFEVWGGKKREVRSVLLNMAGGTFDRQQIFVNTGLLQSSYSDTSTSRQQSSNLSDILAGYSYEVLPEYAFSYWKPVVYLTAFVNLPTGHSIYDDSALTEGTDVTGHNQWGTGIGITVRKVYFPVTLTAQARTIRLLEKQFRSTKVSTFYDSSLALLGNYASRLWDLQLNTGLTMTHLSERRLSPSHQTSGITQNFTVLAGVQRSISENWGAGVNYADQTLVGPAKNTLLNRSISLNFNYNYF